jgi:hypothetical protein
MTMLKTLRREVTAAIANLLDGTADDEEMILARAIARGYFAMCFRVGMHKRWRRPEKSLSSIHCAIGRRTVCGLPVAPKIAIGQF